jgi:hypothetical protein
VLAAALILPLVVEAFVVRVVAVALLRERHPEAAAFVGRNWTWLPMLTVIVLLTVWSWGVGLVAAAIATVVVARPGFFGLPSR